MIDQTMPTTAAQLDRSSSLRLPLQAAPIDRSQSPASAVTADGGVEAAISAEDIFNVASKVPWGSVISGLGGLFSDRTLKRDLTLVEWSR